MPCYLPFGNTGKKQVEGHTFKKVEQNIVKSKIIITAKLYKVVPPKIAKWVCN